MKNSIFMYLSISIALFIYLQNCLFILWNGKRLPKYHIANILFRLFIAITWIISFPLIIIPLKNKEK